MVQEGGRRREAPSETGRRRVLREEDLDRFRVSQRFDRKMRGKRPKMRQMLRGPQMCPGSGPELEQTRHVWHSHDRREAFLLVADLDPEPPAPRRECRDRT